MNPTEYPIVPTAVDHLAEYRGTGPTGQLCVLDQTGDTKVMWNRANPDEVDAARDTFNKLRKKGHIAYAVKPDGGQGAVVTEFDASLEKIILAPAVIGG